MSIHRLVPASKSPGGPTTRQLWRCVNCHAWWPFLLTDEELAASPCPEGDKK